MSERKKSWIVLVRRESFVEVVTEPCTREDAESGNYDPVDETETSVVEEKIISVKANQ